MNTTRIYLQSFQCVLGIGTAVAAIIALAFSFDGILWDSLVGVEIRLHLNLVADGIFDCAFPIELSVAGLLLVFSVFGLYFRSRLTKFGFLLLALLSALICLHIARMAIRI